MATNNILAFCPTDSGTNLLSQVDYAAATDRTNGNQPGVASSKLNNKALRQASLVASQLAQFVADKTGASVLDTDSFEATLLGILNCALLPKKPVYVKLTSGSGTQNLPYYFSITSGSATVGATYTNNSITFTVVSTVASGTLIVMTGSGAPAASGTLTKASGTGDATLTFQAAVAPLYVKGSIVGGGGGGGGSGTGGTSTAGGTGGNTTLGSTLVVANGGTGGVAGTASGSVGASTGGSASIGTGTEGLPLAGASGTGGSNVLTILQGGGGGASPYGGAGGGGYGAGGNGGTAVTNSGSGGGGAGGGSGFGSGGGGAAGGSVHFKIDSPVAMAYAIGVAGTAGAVGTSGNPGGAGGSGVAELYYHFQ